VKVPEIVLDAVAGRPDLQVSHETHGDMIDPEQWGSVLSPPDENGISTYRYLLWRVFDERLPVLIVMMLNPSKATHSEGDRTVDGLVRRARRMGYGTVVVMNCFAYRATEPSEMRKAVDPIGPENDEILRRILSQEGDLLCAWGVNATHMEREKDVKWAISTGKATPHYLRLCAGGAPEHPLYVPLAIGLTRWSPI